MTGDDKDPALEQAFRAQSREMPPRELDAKILAAAHRAVDSVPRKFGAEAMRPPRWWMPLAAAAVIGVVAVGVIQLAPNEPVLDTSPTATTVAKKQKDADQSAAANAPVAPAESPAPAQAPPAVAAARPRVAPTPPAPLPAPRSNIAEQKLAAAPAPKPFPAAPAPQKTESARDASKRDAGYAEEATQPAPPPAAAPAASDKLRKDARNERQVAPASTASPAPGRERAAMRAQSDAAPAAAGAMAGLAQNVAPLEDARAKARDPDGWIARIRKLRDEGRVADVVRELKSFREVVPDAERRLPADLRDWKP